MNTAYQQRAKVFRNRDLARIHLLARKQLALDEETYRALLSRVAGVRSAKDLDRAGRFKVLDELTRLAGDGARRSTKAVPPPIATPQVREELRAMVSKLGAIAAELGVEWAYLDGMARRMFGVDKAEWLTADQMHKLVAALAIHQKRKRKGDAAQ